MYTLLRSATFDAWLRSLADARARARVLARLASAAQGNFGDCEALGGGVREMRIHFGPGYRVYFFRHETTVHVLLGGGDKSSQKRDISNAKAAAR